MNHHFPVLLLFLISLSGCHSNNGNTTLSVAQSITVDGIDVSNHNGSINWEKVSSDDKGISFVYIKYKKESDSVQK